jgi:hypothetical protein
MASESSTNAGASTWPEKSLSTDTSIYYGSLRGAASLINKLVKLSNTKITIQFDLNQHHLNYWRIDGIILRFKYFRKHFI